MHDHKPHPANVSGDFYVEDGCCTMCTVPFSEAPELFGECQDVKGYSHCFVKRQPETPSEVADMLSAIRYAELACIRYGGNDRRIQLDLVEAECGAVCDRLPADMRIRMDEVEADRKRCFAEQQAIQNSIAKKAKQWWKFWG